MPPHRESVENLSTITPNLHTQTNYRRNVIMAVPLLATIAFLQKQTTKKVMITMQQNTKR
jgi:hypothetical protein